MGLARLRVFPACKRSADPRTGQMRRHHTDPTGLQKAVKRAVVKAGLTKAASVHTFRHCFGRPFGRLVNTL